MEIDAIDQPIVSCTYIVSDLDKHVVFKLYTDQNHHKTWQIWQIWYTDKFTKTSTDLTEYRQTCCTVDDKLQQLTIYLLKVGKSVQILTPQALNQQG